MKIYNISNNEMLNINKIKLSDLPNIKKTYILWMDTISEMKSITKETGIVDNVVKISLNKVNETRVYLNVLSSDILEEYKNIIKKYFGDIYISDLDTETTKEYLADYSADDLRELKYSSFEDAHIKYIGRCNKLDENIIHEKLNINPINISDLNSVHSNKDRINEFLKNPKKNLKTNDIVKIDGDLFFVIDKHDVNQYIDKYKMFDYKNGLFYYTAIDHDNEPQPMTMSFYAYDKNLNYIGGFASVEDFTIHEIYLYVGISNHKINDIEILTQELLEKTISANDIDYIKVEI